MPASSAPFETTLKPDRRLRRWLRLCGGLAGVAGSAMIVALPVSAVLRSLLLVAWVVECTREWRALLRGGRRIRALRLDCEGRVTGVGADGRHEPLELLAGSMVLARFAWLRLRFTDGSRHGELIAGDAGTDPAWHRLQLIWNLRRSAFGRPDGS